MYHFPLHCPIKLTTRGSPKQVIKFKDDPLFNNHCLLVNLSTRFGVRWHNSNSQPADMCGPCSWKTPIEVSESLRKDPWDSLAKERRCSSVIKAFEVNEENSPIRTSFRRHKKEINEGWEKGYISDLPWIGKQIKERSSEQKQKHMNMLHCFFRATL